MCIYFNISVLISFVIQIILRRTKIYELPLEFKVYLYESYVKDFEEKVSVDINHCKLA